MKTLTEQSPAAGEAAHTPTPWQLTPIDNAIRGRIYWVTAPARGHLKKIFIADAGFDVDGANTRKEADANAAFIVRACNSHDALVEALAEAEIALATIECQDTNQASKNLRFAKERATRALPQARAALKLATS